MPARPMALRYAQALVILGLMSGASTATLAAQIGPNTVLDTEIRAQGVDLDNGDLGTSGSDNIGTAALEARLKLTHHFNDNDLFFWEGRGVASAGRAGFESSDT